jgi:mRNA-degrading endonuclease toxin of MazEF toxin-antitoxin module
MRGVNLGEVWMIDFGMAAKVRPALLLTGEPGADELDLVTVTNHRLDCFGQGILQ